MQKILIIDDIEKYIENLLEYLKFQEFEAIGVVCKSVEEALAAVHERQPEIILLDNSLDNSQKSIVEGVEVARILRDEGFQAMIISNSGWNREEQISYMVPVGVRHFASKLQLDVVDCIRGTCDCEKILAEYLGQ